MKLEFQNVMVFCATLADKKKTIGLIQLSFFYIITKVYDLRLIERRLNHYR